MHGITTQNTHGIRNVIANLLIGNFSCIIFICRQICQHVSHRRLLIGDFLQAFQSVKLCLRSFTILRKNTIEDNDLLREHLLKTIDKQRSTTRTSATCSGRNHKDHIRFLNRVDEAFRREDLLQIILQELLCSIAIATCTTTTTDDQCRNFVRDNILTEVFVGRIDHNDRKAKFHRLNSDLTSCITNTYNHILQRRFHHNFVSSFYDVWIRVY